MFPECSDLLLSYDYINSTFLSLMILTSGLSGFFFAIICYAPHSLNYLFTFCFIRRWVFRKKRQLQKDRLG